MFQTTYSRKFSPIRRVVAELWPFSGFSTLHKNLMIWKVRENRSVISQLLVDRSGWKFGCELFETFYYDLMTQIFALSQLLLCCPLSNFNGSEQKRGSTMKFHIFSKSVLWSWPDNVTFLAKLSLNKVYIIPYKYQVSNPSRWGDTDLAVSNLLS